MGFDCSSISPSFFCKPLVRILLGWWEQQKRASGPHFPFPHPTQWCTKETSGDMMNNIQLGFSLLQFHIYTVLCVLQPIRTSNVSSFRFRDLRGYICFQKRNLNTRARIKRKLNFQKNLVMQFFTKHWNTKHNVLLKQMYLTKYYNMTFYLYIFISVLYRKN